MPRFVFLFVASAFVVAPAFAFAQTPTTSPGGEPITPGGTQAGDLGGNSAPAHPTPAEPSAAPPGRSVPATEPPANLDALSTPIIDLHGYIRTRAALYQNFSLGWETSLATGVPMTSPPAPGTSTGGASYTSSNLPWYRNPDFNAQFCGSTPNSIPVPGAGPVTASTQCGNGTQTTANMRMRLNPEIHPTEFIGVYSQIDILDNLVLGSTPQGYYLHDTRSPYAPITALSNTQIPPTYGYNGFTQSIVAKRAWAVISNQNLGEIAFGRMPSHWGLGIFNNDGNGMDSDFQTTVDRIRATYHWRYGTFVSAMWDFPSSGATNANPVNEPGEGQFYDLSLYDDVHQWSGQIGRIMPAHEARAAMARGELVVNGGLYFQYRTQTMSGEGINSTNSTQLQQIEACTGPSGYTGTCGQQFVRRDASIFIPDLWLQVLGRDFRAELEAVYVGGTIRDLNNDPTHAQNTGYTLNQFGLAIETEYRALNQRLLIGVNGGYASGDDKLNTINGQGGIGSTAALSGTADRNLSLYAFHPDYRIDLIFWREIYQQVVGAYYFRPSLGYNFIDEPGGDLLFGRVDVIWSRASQFMQTRGHHADLGVEIDATVQYQSNHRRNDGVDRRPLPGFYANIQGGVFFPLAGLGPNDSERLSLPYSAVSLETAFVVRGFAGVMF